MIRFVGLLPLIKVLGLAKGELDPVCGAKIANTGLPDYLFPLQVRSFLLYHMGQLMRQKMLTFPTLWTVTSRVKANVPAESKSLRVQRLYHLNSETVGMNER